MIFLLRHTVLKKHLKKTEPYIEILTTLFDSANFRIGLG